MPRIPEPLLDRIKQEISIRLLAERQGVALRKTGDELMGLCPFHKDTSPSLAVNEAQNLWHCLGACQTGGTAIDWVMRREGISFRQAVEVLIAEFFPLDASALRALPPKRSSVPKLASPLDEAADDRQVALDVVGYYLETLKQSPEALAYLEKRGLRNAEVIDRFRLGYANRTLGYRLPITATKTGQAIRGRLQRIGFVRESGHEHLNGSLVIPLFDETGGVVQAYGRKIRDDLRPGTPDHLYLPGPHRGVFNHEALTASTEIILCEALIDALTFWCAGFRNVTSAYGVNGFTDELLDAMKAHGTERVVIAYDRDEAGDSAADTLSKRLIAEGIVCSRVLFPKGMDANAYALKVSPPSVSLGVLLRSAEWIGNGRRASVASAAEGHAEAAIERDDRAAKKENSSEPAQGADSPTHTSSPVGAPRNGTHVPAMDALIVAPTSLESWAAPLVADATPAVLPAGLTKLVDDEADFAFDDRHYRARGLRKCLAYGSLRVSLRAERIAPELFAPPSPLEGWHLDTVDLCLHRQRAAFEKQAAHEMGVKEEVVHRDLGVVVRILEGVQEKRISEATAPKQKTVTMSDQETADGLDFWKGPDLMTRIVDDFTICGLVGEATNKLATYIAACSRLLDRPLAIIVQSSSAAGKSSLMDAVLGLMPAEMREKYTAVSGKSLFYFDEDTSLRHKILAIVEEEGAERATYPLKILQSEGELVMASTGKDPATGKLVTKTYRVEGPVMIILTTTSIDLDPELENRCLRLTVDESREQTRAIHELQRMRMTFEGHQQKVEKEKLRKLHQNAQRLLRKINVHNPYARHLTFVDEQTRTRRDHDKYLTLIETIALMHQHQRPVYRREMGGVSEEFLDVTLDDIELAGRLAGEILGRFLDELQPQTRIFLMALHQAITKLCDESGVERSELRFMRRQIRELTGWNDTQLRVHMARLIELEYVLVHRGGRGQSFVYELLYNGEGADGRPFVLGLVDVDSLRQEPQSMSTTETSRGLTGHLAGGVRSGCGGDAGSVRPPLNGHEPAPGAAFSDSDVEGAENAQLPTAREESYTPGCRTATPRLNLLRFPPQPKPPECGEEQSDEPAATVTPIPKPHKRLPGGRSGRPLRRVYPDAVL